MKRQVIFAIALLTAISSEMAAQRTMNGQYFVSARLSHDFSSAESFGGGLSFGQYLLNSYWKATAGVDNRATGLTTGHSMQYMHIHIGGDWMYRCIATNDRALSLYLGGGIFMGYEGYDTFGTLPANISTGLDNGAFLYGIRANLELEYYFSKKVGLIAEASLPMHFGSPTGWLKWSTGLGIRYNF